MRRIIPITIIVTSPIANPIIFSNIRIARGMAAHVTAALFANENIAHLPSLIIMTTINNTTATAAIIAKILMLSLILLIHLSIAFEKPTSSISSLSYNFSSEAYNLLY